LIDGCRLCGEQDPLAEQVEVGSAEHRAFEHFPVDVALDRAGAVWQAVAMSQIAEQTGIGRATLYKYFPDVDAILHAWHERQIAGHLAQLAAARDRPGARLEAVLRTYALTCITTSVNTARCPSMGGCFPWLRRSPVSCLPPDRRVDRQGSGRVRMIEQPG